MLSPQPTSQLRLTLSRGCSASVLLKASCVSWKEDTRKLANASSCIRGCPAYWRCAWAVSSTTCAWSRVAAACAGVCLDFLACKRPS